MPPHIHPAPTGIKKQWMPSHTWLQKTCALSTPLATQGSINWLTHWISGLCYHHVTILAELRCLPFMTIAQKSCMRSVNSIIFCHHKGPMVEPQQDSVFFLFYILFNSFIDIFLSCLFAFFLFFRSNLSCLKKYQSSKFNKCLFSNQCDIIIVIVMTISIKIIVIMIFAIIEQP